MSDCGCGQIGEAPAAGLQQRRALIILLAINALMFVVEFGAAWWAHSSALLADSGDMLADALVYIVSLLALKRTLHWRAGASLLMALSQFVLGIGVIVQVFHILLAGQQPEGVLMLIVAAIAALANGAGATLLLRYRHRDINMRAVWLCTRNDIIANVATSPPRHLATSPPSPPARRSSFGARRGRMSSSAVCWPCCSFVPRGALPARR